jgi:hypothetical protein
VAAANPAASVVQALLHLDPRRREHDPVDVVGDGVCGLLVERRAALVQAVEARLLLRERTVAAAHSGPGGRGIDLDVHGQGTLAQRAPDRLGLDRAAAERDDGRPFVAQRLECRLGLEHAKLGLTALAEDLRDRLPQRALELAVEVDEPAPQPLGHLHPERRLARAHEADEGKVPV